jgi:hypothetical protein
MRKGGKGRDKVSGNGDTESNRVKRSMIHWCHGAVHTLRGTAVVRIIRWSCAPLPPPPPPPPLSNIFPLRNTSNKAETVGDVHATNVKKSVCYVPRS